MDESSYHWFDNCNFNCRFGRRRFFLGTYLDNHWSTDPWMKIVLMLMGLVLGGAYLITTLKGLSEDEEG